MEIFWIDDNPEREPGASSMSDTTGENVRFFNLQGQNLEKELEKIITEQKEPTLIILDQNLEDATEGVFKKGSTAAAYIKENWPECPIVCVTGGEIDTINNQQKSSFEDVFPISNISKYYDVLTSIASSFDQAKANRPTSLEDILQILKVPIRDKTRLESVLPTQIKENISDKTLVVEISRWVRGVLICRPGFLYDRLWIATVLGIKEESFKKVEYLFDSAKYEGLFHSNSYERWWKSTALDKLYELSNVDGLPWESGRGLPNIEQEDFSECYASGEQYPETVAFTDTTANAHRYPMKLKYTILHPEYENLLHFDNIRLMKAAE